MRKITFLFTILIFSFSFGQTIEGTWKLKPSAGSLGVGPNQGDVSWWSNSTGDVATRACLFDDEYVFDTSGNFDNVLGSDTWVETWQGGSESCAAPVAPHDSSNAATYTYDSGAGTLTVNGTGAYMGIAKAINGDELDGTVAVPSSVTYQVTSLTATELTLDINVGGGWWRFVFEKDTGAPITIEGTWKLKPSAGSLGVGPNQGDVSWWSNSTGDVATRACLFDDEYVFDTSGNFDNVLGSDTWVETWQGGSESCAAPVAPHDSSNAATYTYDSGAGTLTVNGTGAYMGIAKAINGDELDGTVAVPSSVTYQVTSLTATELTLDIDVGGGWWRFVFEKFVAGTDATLSDLQADGTTVSGFASGTLAYTIDLDTSVMTPPNVSATTTDNAANASITQASAIPGDATVLVTAADGTTQQTYTVSFVYVDIPMTAAPTPPARPSADVYSIFSDAYTNVTIDGWGPNWGGSSARINDVTIATNATKIMEVEGGQTFAGIDFSTSSAFDATSFTHFHMDYYISGSLATGQALSIKLSNHNGGTGETSAIQTSPTPTAGAWVSIDVPLADFVAASAPSNLDRNAIAQIILSAARADGSVPVDIYLDNIYFHKNSVLNTEEFETTQFKVFPNPTQDNWNIESNNTINNIQVFDILGKRILTLEPNANNATINTSDIKTGVYLARIEGVNGSKTVRLIKE